MVASTIIHYAFQMYFVAVSQVRERCGFVCLTYDIILCIKYLKNQNDTYIFYVFFFFARGEWSNIVTITLIISFQVYSHSYYYELYRKYILHASSSLLSSGTVHIVLEKGKNHKKKESVFALISANNVFDIQYLQEPLFVL